MRRGNVRVWSTGLPPNLRHTLDTHLGSVGRWVLQTSLAYPLAAATLGQLPQLCGLLTATAIVAERYAFWLVLAPHPTTRGLAVLALAGMHVGMFLTLDVRHHRDVPP